MNTAKLNVKGLAIALGLIWAAAVFIVGVVNLVNADYGEDFLFVISSVYPGYHADPTFGSVLIGTGYALIDGAIAGALVAWCYNFFSKAK